MKKIISLLRKVKEGLSKLRDLSCSWVGRFSIIKMIILPEYIYMVNTVPIKIPEGFWWNQQTGSEIHMKSNRHKRAKTILKQKNKVGLLLLDFKTYSKLTASDNSRALV